MGSLYHLPAGRISPFSFEAEARQHAESFGQFDGGGPPSDNGGMEARIARLEAKLDYLATKEDLAKLDTKLSNMESNLVKWIVGTAIALGTAAITVMTFVLNNATPKEPAPAPAPTVIVVPTPAATPASS